MNRNRMIFGCLAAVGFALGATFIVPGCSGPQPLAKAIRSSDQQAYERALARHPSSPRQAFYQMKAAETGLPVDEITTMDEALSTTRNPFDANHDPAAVSRGGVIFQAHCVRCHGQDVGGNGPDMLADHPTKDFHAFGKRFAVTLHKGAPRTWFKKINAGYGEEVVYPDGVSRAMPAFGDTLAREQIWLAITYLQSLDMYAQDQPPN